MERPFEIDRDEYPFKDHWFPVRDGHMHYLDEGQGPVVLLLHGNPTWSYLYRNVIKALRSSCRLIAPDHLGFGMSRAPSDYRYTPAEHAQSLTSLVEHLQLKEITLVVQDWGGPIGMHYAVEHPANIRALVVMNTWVFQPDRKARVFSSLMGGWPFGKLLQTRFNFFARVIVPKSIHHKQNVTPELRHAYTMPFPTPASRIGTWVFPREIVAAAPWLAQIESRLALLADKPTELLWAMRDKAFGDEKVIAQWRSYLKNSDLERLEDADHYLQEDRPDRVVAAIERAVARSQPTTVR